MGKTNGAEVFKHMRLRQSIINAMNKAKSMSPGVKTSIALLLSNMVQKGISYLTTPIYTRMLTTEEYGQVNVFLTWQQLFGIVAMFCLSYGVFNNGMIDYPKKRDEYSYSMLILSNILTIVFSALLVISLPISKRYLKMGTPLIFLMIVNFLFQPAYAFWNARQRYELKYKAMIVWALLIAFISPIVAVICIYYTNGSRFNARIFGAEGSLIAIYIIFYVIVGKKAKWKLNKTYWREALRFNLPLIPHYLSMYLLGSSDRLMIANMVNESAAAVYSVASSVASIAIVIWSSINSSLIPYTYERCKEKNYKAISRVVQPILIVFAILCAFIILCAPEVVRFMATEEYLEAIYVIPPIIGGVFFQVQYYIYANIVYYYKKPKYVMYASLSATVLNLVLNYIFIKQFGFLAAGYTTIICYCLQAILDYLAMKKVVNEEIYNMRFIVCLSIVVIFIALFSNLLYSYSIVRYCIIIAVFCGAIIKRKTLLSVFKALKE